MHPDATKPPLRNPLFLLALCYAIPLLVFGWRIGPFDYNHLSTYYELAWRFWSTQRGLPQYNPFLCGGRTLGGDPQIPIFHPLTLLVPILGATWLIKIEMLAQLGLGIWGLRRLLDRFGVDEAGKNWATLLYAGGGAVLARFLVGHVTMGFLFLYPLFIALAYRLEETRSAKRQRIFTAYAALFIYCSLYKPNFLIYGVPPLLVEAVVRAALTKRPRVLIEFVAATALGAGVGAVSFLPAARYFHDFPRPDDGPPASVPWWTLLANLVLPLKALPAAFYGSRFLQRHEYNAFLGPVGLFFAWLGCKRVPPAARPRLYAIAALGLFSAWIGCARDGAGFSWFSPYSWFQEFWPGFQSVRVSVRFWFATAFALTVFSAIGFRLPRTRQGSIALFIVGILPLLAQAAVNLGETAWPAKLTQWGAPRVYRDPIELRHAAPDEPYAYVRTGRATIECPPNLEVFPAQSLREGDELSVAATSPLVENEVHWLGWDRIAVHLRTQGKGAFVAIFNLNHADYWKFEGHGGIASNRREPLAVASEDNTVTGTLTFRQPYVAESLRLSGLSLALFAAFGFWAFQPTRRKRQALRIGLTGGIAAGKSTAAAIIRELGVPVIDLDQIGREITDRFPALVPRIVRIFGQDVAPDGKLDRRRLREAVFKDEGKRRRLEALLHPPIRREFERECREVEKKGAKLVICEAALLVEGGYFRHLDGLIVLTAPAVLRQERLQARDNLTADLAAKIFLAQKTDAEKLQVATHHVENSGDRAQLAAQIREIIDELKEENAG